MASDKGDFRYCTRRCFLGPVAKWRAPGVEPLSEIPDGAKPILPLQTGGRLRRPEPDRGSDSIQADRRRRTATVQA